MQTRTVSCKTFFENLYLDAKEEKKLTKGILVRCLNNIQTSQATMRIDADDRQYIKSTYNALYSMIDKKNSSPFKNSHTHEIITLMDKIVKVTLKEDFETVTRKFSRDDKIGHSELKKILHYVKTYKKSVIFEEKDIQNLRMKMKIHTSEQCGKKLKKKYRTFHQIAVNMLKIKCAEYHKKNKHEQLISEIVENCFPKEKFLYIDSQIDNSSDRSFAKNTDLSAAPLQDNTISRGRFPEKAPQNLHWVFGGPHEFASSVTSQATAANVAQTSRKMISGKNTTSFRSHQVRFSFQ